MRCLVDEREMLLDCWWLISLVDETLFLAVMHCRLAGGSPSLAAEGNEQMCADFGIWKTNKDEHKELLDKQFQ
jgi:hypothetical protein